MDFSFSEEQVLLRNSISKYLAENYGFETFKKISHGEPGWSRENWKQFAELGLLAAPFPEAHGGLGGGPVDTMIIMEEFGRALVVEPYASTVVVAGNFLMRGGSQAQKEEWLGKIAGGRSSKSARAPRVIPSRGPSGMTRALPSRKPITSQGIFL